MKRRAVLVGLGGVLAGLGGVIAQPAGRLFKVGLVFTTSPVSEMIGPDPIHPLVRVFTQALRDLGYVEGQNLVLECRSAEGKFERFGEIVAELVARQVDVIVTAGDKMAQEAKRVTNAVPIVMASSYDPVGTGIITNLARPGSNVTGLINNPSPDIDGKRLQLLKEALPEATHVAFLGMAVDWEGPEGTSVKAAARLLGVTLIFAEHTPTHYADAFALITQDRPHALFVARSNANFGNRLMIAKFADKHRIPSICPYREIVEAGGLLSYGTSTSYLYRRAAGHVVKILKGAKPADIPVEQPTQIELVINLRTASALGLTIPPTLLATADEVIE